jgi:EAL domain-containing protein (putative c-di-GMP-specific phosphodiesterase class I)
MICPRVLVLESYLSQRTVLVRMLYRLGVRDVLQASEPEQVMDQISRAGDVDIIICSLNHKGLEGLDFLGRTREKQRVQAVVLCGECSADLHRALESLGSLSGLPILGVLSAPFKLRSLYELLLRYGLRGAIGQPCAAPQTVLSMLPNEVEIRRSLALGHFRGWYQPKFQLADASLAGVEVLARWEHPRKGVLLPKDFLAAMVAYDLIDEMFKQLLDQGLTLLQTLDQHAHLGLAFNLHISQLIKRELVEHIKTSLKRHGFAGNILTFELAENGLSDLCPTTRKHIFELHNMGCNLSIDNFGSGFFSLSLLSQLPLSQIKLDASVIEGIKGSHDHTLISSAQTLAHALGKGLVIEGISNRNMLERLMNMGCTLGQGYYLARPMSGQDFQSWLSQEDIENHLKRTR